MIKRLAYKLIILILPFLCIFSILENMLNTVPNTYSIKRSLLEKELGQIEVLTTGSSHGFGIDPEYFSRPGFTLFSNSQDIYYDIKLVNKYIDQMPNLKLIIMPISYFSFEYKLSQSDQTWRTFFYQRFWEISPENIINYFDIRSYSYAALYGSEKVISLVTNNFIDPTIPSINSQGYWGSIDVLKDNTKTIKNNDIEGLAQVREADARNRLEYIPDITKQITSFLSMCHQKGITVVFVTIPVTHYYYDHLNRDRYERMQGCISVISKSFGVQYFNYLKDDRFDSTDFYNTDHLNVNGAEKFSKILDQEIIQPFFSSITSQ